MEPEDEIPPTEGELVPLPPPPDAAPPVEEKTGPTESINLVSSFEEDEVMKLAEMALDDYDGDVSSRADHMKSLRKDYELYAAVTKIKNWPFQNCANVSLPILAYSVLQIHGRLFDQLVPAKGDVFHSKPTRITDPAEVDRAGRTELFLNWYLREQVPEFRTSFDDSLWQLVIFGSMFRYNYWDILENKLCPDWIGVEDLVVNYHCRVTSPALKGKSMRFTRVRWMSLFEIQDRAAGGEYDPVAVAEIQPEEPDDQHKSEFAETVDKIDGKEPSTRNFLEDEDRQVLEQHRWIRMPDRPEAHRAFDGKPHPVVITIDESSRKILRIVLREEDDPRDAKRFHREKDAFDQAMAQMTQWEQSGGMTLDQMTGQPMPVPRPQVPEEPKPTRQRELSMVTHYRAFSGEGFYGLGIGSFLGRLNEAANTLINQQIDRSTVNNAGGGMISKQVRFQRGSITKSPGEYIEIDAPASAMKDALQSWPQVAPDPDGRWFLTYIEQMANRTAGTGDTLSGEPVGSNETARAAMARYEQAQKQISVLASRVVNYMTCDVMSIWRLLSVYLDEQEYHDVVDSMGEPRQVQIGRADFIPDARVVPTADPRMTSRASRLEEAMGFMTTVTSPQSPPELSQNPAIRRAAIEAYLIAADRHEMLKMLGPPPGPPQPPQPKPQWEENSNFLRDKDSPTNPQDDDDAHLIDMQQFKGDPLGYEKMSPTGRKMFDNHERGHLAQKHEKARKQDEQRRQQLGQLLGAQGGGPPGLAPVPPNGPPPQGPLS